MIPKPDGWSVIVTGQWNPHIFSPGWVGPNLFGLGSGAKIPVEVRFGPGAAAQFRLISDHVKLQTDNDRLVFLAGQPSIDDLGRAEEMAVKALELLPHTPVSGYGVNLAFQENSTTNLPQAFLEFFNCDDFVSLQGFQTENAVKERYLVRKLSLGSCELNLKLTNWPEEDRAEIAFNFHHDLAEGTNILEFVNTVKGKSKEYETTAVEIAERAYGLSLDEETDEHD